MRRLRLKPRFFESDSRTGAETTTIKDAAVMPMMEIEPDNLLVHCSQPVWPVKA